MASKPKIIKETEKIIKSAEKALEKSKKMGVLQEHSSNVSEKISEISNLILEHIKNQTAQGRIRIEIEEIISGLNELKNSQVSISQSKLDKLKHELNLLKQKMLEVGALIKSFEKKHGSLRDLEAYQKKLINVLDKISAKFEKDLVMAEGFDAEMIEGINSEIDKLYEDL